jgi:hypothetical protein
MPTGGGLNKVTFLSTYLSKDNRMPPEYTYLTSQESYFYPCGSIQGICSRICLQVIFSILQSAMVSSLHDHSHRPSRAEYRIHQIDNRNAGCAGWCYTGFGFAL